MESDMHSCLALHPAFYLAQIAALRPLPFWKALWSGDEHRTGAGDSASGEFSSVLHLSWKLH